MNQEHELFDVARKLRYDLTAAQAKVTDLLNMLAALNLPQLEKVTCPRCGVPIHGDRGLEFHMQNVHDGPLVPMTPQEERA